MGELQQQIAAWARAASDTPAGDAQALRAEVARLRVALSNAVSDVEQWRAHFSRDEMLDRARQRGELDALRAEVEMWRMAAGDRGPQTEPIAAVLADIARERMAQDARWGEQNHPDGTGPRVPFAGHLCYMAEMAESARLATKSAAGELGPTERAKRGLNWRLILLEEVFEALAEDDPEKLRTELVQVAAVAAAWAECLDRRKRPATRPFIACELPVDGGWCGLPIGHDESKPCMPAEVHYRLPGNPRTFCGEDVNDEAVSSTDEAGAATCPACRKAADEEPTEVGR